MKTSCGTVNEGVASTRHGSTPRKLAINARLRRSPPQQLVRCFRLLVIWPAIVAGPTFAQSADSVWLDYQEGLGTSGDVIMTDMQVEATAIYTYYAGLVWNNGYMGLQRGGAGFYKHVHFSVWDPSGGGVSDLVTAGSGVVTQRFGGEGTGWQAMWPFNWAQNTTYRLCVTLTHTNSATDYAAYFFDPTAGTWKHLATFARKDAQHSFSYIASFLEDFGSTLNSRRSCLFGNTWLRTFQTNWIDLRAATYATGGSQTNKDADVVGGMFRLQTGGSTTKHTPAYTTLSRAPADALPTDHHLQIGIANPGQSVLLRWQTLPWPSYYLEVATNLLQWPPNQRQVTASNKWVEAFGGNSTKFFRTTSSE